MAQRARGCLTAPLPPLLSPALWVPLMPAQESLSQLEIRVLDLVRNEVLQTTPGFTVTSDLFEAGLDSMAIMQLLLQLVSEKHTTLIVVTHDPALARHGDRVLTIKDGVIA